MAGPVVLSRTVPTVRSIRSAAWTGQSLVLGWGAGRSGRITGGGVAEVRAAEGAPGGGGIAPSAIALTLVGWLGVPGGRSCDGPRRRYGDRPWLGRSSVLRV